MIVESIELSVPKEFKEAASNGRKSCRSFDVINAHNDSSALTSETYFTCRRLLESRSGRKRDVSLENCQCKKPVGGSIRWNFTL